MSTETESVTTTKIKEPSLFKVILLNDHFTSMDFVIQILTDIFCKPDDEARSITMQIHHEGKGVVGIYPREIADQKIAETHACASHYGHPLKAISELA
jgi:ATP-dependent Clp protease adaptor protein ClpS